MIIGKAALEEYATSGNYSNDAWGQVWNVFNPSKSAIASSGGSASARGGELGRRPRSDRRPATRCTGPRARRAW